MPSGGDAQRSCYVQKSCLKRASVCASYYSAQDTNLIPDSDKMTNAPPSPKIDLPRNPCCCSERPEELGKDVRKTTGWRRVVLDANRPDFARHATHASTVTVAAYLLVDQSCTRRIRWLNVTLRQAGHWPVTIAVVDLAGNEIGLRYSPSTTMVRNAGDGSRRLTPLLRRHLIT